MHYILITFLLFFGYVAWRNLRVALYLILLFIPTYLLKFQILSIPANLLELLIYTAFLVWLILIFAKKQTINWGAIKKYLWPINLILTGLIIGVLISSDILISLGILKGWFIVPFLLFIMLISVLYKKLHVKKAIMALIFSGLFLSVIALWQVVTHNYITIDNRASGLFESANYLSLYLVPIIVLSFGFVLSLKSKLKWSWSMLIILMIAALYFTFSYSGWIGLIVGVGILMLMLLPFWPTIIGIGGIGLIGVLSQLNNPKFQQMLDIVDRSSSSVRLQVWQSAILMLKENYLLGIGLGLFEKKYPNFASRLFNPPLEPVMLHAHNIFLHSWLNLGLIGFVGFVWLLINFFKNIYQAIKKQKTKLNISVMAAMIALLVHGLVDTPYWKNDLAILFWVILAFGIILSQNENNQRRKTSISNRN